MFATSNGWPDEADARAISGEIELTPNRSARPRPVKQSSSKSSLREIRSNVSVAITALNIA